MYQIKELAELSGVSTRTLRYYDQINLLKPSQLSAAGYRLYGKKEIKILQQILFLKELNFTLNDITEILNDPEKDQLTLFNQQLQALIDQREKLDLVINLMQKTIKEIKGDLQMSDVERFEAFKEQQIKNNRKEYGNEVIELFGEKELFNAEKKFRSLNKEQLFEEMGQIENLLIKALKKEVIIPSNQAEIIYHYHQKWLSYTLDLTPEIHRSLAEMYIFDERFTAYYDNKAGQSATQKLFDVIQFYTKEA